MADELMTPRKFAQLYLELPTYLYPLESGETSRGNPAKEGWKTLRVGLYRLGHSPWYAKLWQDIKPNFRKPVTITVKPIGKPKQEVRLSVAQANSHFYYPFVGKGSPEQAQIAVQLTYRFHKAVFTPEEFVQKFIGLDCNGFVGNYIQRVVQGMEWQTQNNDKDVGPTTFMSQLIRDQGKDNQITDLEDLCPDDTYILVMCEPNGLPIDPTAGRYGHVMITNPGKLQRTANGTSFDVIESCGGKGLSDSVYTIYKVVKAELGTVFYCHRGDAGGDIKVRIARLAVK
jgi:hypothetical protein